MSCTKGRLKRWRDKKGPQRGGGEEGKTQSTCQVLESFIEVNERIRQPEKTPSTPEAQSKNAFSLPVHRGTDAPHSLESGDDQGKSPIE